MSIQNIEQIEAWAAKSGGVDAVRRAMAERRWGDNVGTIALVEEWLRRQDEAARAEADARDFAIRVREVEAAESAAESARHAAVAAHASTRLARIALFVSVIAALFTAWPLLPIH